MPVRYLYRKADSPKHNSLLYIFLVLTRHKRVGYAFHILIRSGFSPVTRNRIYRTRVRVYFEDTQNTKKRPFGPHFFLKPSAIFCAIHHFFARNPRDFFLKPSATRPNFFLKPSGTDYVNFRTFCATPGRPKSHTRLKKSGIGPALAHPNRAISAFPDLSPPL